MLTEIIYDQRTVEVLKRAKEFCEESGLNLIEPIFLFREILQEADCSFYEYLQGVCDTEEIESVMDSTLEEMVGMLKAKKKKEDEEEQASSLCLEADEENCCFKMTETLADIWEEMIQMVERLGEQVGSHIEQMDFGEDFQKAESFHMVVYPDFVMGRLIERMPNDIARYIRKLDLTVSEVKEDFLYFQENMKQENTQTLQEAKEKSDIPEDMKGFLREFIPPEEGKRLILGRDKETRQLWNIISKKNKRNAVLVGEPGVGKTALVRKLAEDINNGDCPEKFKGYRVMALDITGMIAGTTYRGQAEERFNLLRAFLEEHDNVIVFVDEIHTMLGAGATKDGELDLANSIKPVLAGEKGIVIGATTSEEYTKVFSRDAALKRRFERVEVKEPKAGEVYHMLKNQIASLEEYHGVKVTKQMVDFIIFAASCFQYETKNPDRTLDLLDRSMVVAKNRGRANVNRACVLENFNVNYELFRRMSASEKKFVAYHEAGHFVVHEKSGLLNNNEVTAISIMPTDTYLGVNVFEETDETVAKTMEYYIDSMAMLLAGREAERMMLSKDNAGVSGDLEQATKIAYRVITTCGMVEGYHMAYLDENGIKLLNEKTIGRIGKSVQELLKKAETRAREILEQNRDLLVAIAEELLKRKMISKKDLKQIICKVSNPVNK